jgi:hypothetical protein
MHTDTTTQKGKPTGSANYPAGHTDSASLPTAVSMIKSKLIHSAAWLALVLGGLA